MPERECAVSEMAWARMAGWSLLAIILFGFVGMDLRGGFHTGSLVTFIYDHELSYRAGLAFEFLMLNCDILLAVALYGLLKRMDSTLALLGTLWRLANALALGIGVAAALGSISFVHEPEFGSQLRELHSRASDVGLLFWALGASVHSYLLWKSRAIPRLLSGAYLVVPAMIFFYGLSKLVFPAIGGYSWRIVMLDLPVELTVGFWLAIKGATIRPAAARL